MNLSDRDKRILKIAGPVLGVIVVGFLAFNLLAGGGDEVPTPGPVLPSGVAPTPAPTESPSPEPTASPIVVFAGRDPFSIPPALTSPTTTSTSSPTSSGSPSGSSSPTATSTPTTPSNGTTKEIGGRTVVLLDVFTRGGVAMAQVTVNSTPYTVAEGDRFAGRYQLVSVSGECANFLFGDESFRLCSNAPK